MTEQTFDNGKLDPPITRSPDHPIPLILRPARLTADLTRLQVLAAASWLLVATFSLSGCVGEVSPAQQGGPELDSARALLARVSPALAAESFARLERVAYTADVRMAEGDAPATVRNVSHVPGAAVDSIASLGGDPVGRMVPDTPPHLAPRTRDRYRVRLLPEVLRNGRRLAGAEAALLDTSDEEPVRRVRSWADADTGAPFAVEVWRASASAIFDEEGRAGVVFSQRGGELYPAATSSISRIDVPFGEPRDVRVDVTIVDVDP